MLCLFKLVKIVLKLLLLFIPYASNIILCAFICETFFIIWVTVTQVHFVYGNLRTVLSRTVFTIVRFVVIQLVVAIVEII